MIRLRPQSFPPGSFFCLGKGWAGLMSQASGLGALTWGARRTEAKRWGDYKTGPEPWARAASSEDKEVVGPEAGSTPQPCRPQAPALTPSVQEWLKSKLRYKRQPLFLSRHGSDPPSRPPSVAHWPGKSCPGLRPLDKGQRVHDASQA